MTGRGVSVVPGHLPGFHPSSLLRFAVKQPAVNARSSRVWTMAMNRVAPRRGPLTSSSWHQAGRKAGTGRLLMAPCMGGRCLCASIDQGACVQGVAHAADLVLEGGQHLAGVQVGDVLKAVLALVAFLGDQVAFEQTPVHA